MLAEICIRGMRVETEESRYRGRPAWPHHRKEGGGEEERASIRHGESITVPSHRGPRGNPRGGQEGVRSSHLSDGGGRKSNSPDPQSSSGTCELCLPNRETSRLKRTNHLTGRKAAGPEWKKTRRKREGNSSVPVSVAVSISSGEGVTPREGGQN